MVDFPNSITPNSQHRLPNNFFLKSKLFKFLSMKWHPDKNSPSLNHETEAKSKSSSEVYEGPLTAKKKNKNKYWVFLCYGENEKSGASKGNDPAYPKNGENKKGRDDQIPSPRTGNHPCGENKKGEGDQLASPRTCNHPFDENNKEGCDQLLSPGTCNHPSEENERDASESDDPLTPTTPKGSSMGLQPSLSRCISRRDGSPIMFSYSMARKKPPPTEKKLECTLEDLYFGCVKKIMLTREVLADNGIMVQEEELLRIKVEPGWKQGTRITFEGIGDELPGMLPSDVIFSIVEEKHPLFKRGGDNLVLEARVPLVKALTGDAISIPLISGEELSCSFKEIIYPGYEKIIEGLGMPVADETGKRGDMRIKFHVDFPTQLSEEQRLDISTILQDAS